MEKELPFLTEQRSIEFFAGYYNIENPTSVRKAIRPPWRGVYYLIYSDDQLIIIKKSFGGLNRKKARASKVDKYLSRRGFRIIEFNQPPFSDVNSIQIFETLKDKAEQILEPDEDLISICRVIGHIDLTKHFCVCFSNKRVIIFQITKTAEILSETSYFLCEISDYSFLEKGKAILVDVPLVDNHFLKLSIKLSSGQEFKFRVVDIRGHGAYPV